MYSYRSNVPTTTINEDNERKCIMTTNYIVSWSDANKKLLTADHDSKRGAQQKARDMSHEFGAAKCIEMVNGSAAILWTYLKGELDGVETKEGASENPDTTVFKGKKPRVGIKATTEAKEGPSGRDKGKDRGTPKDTKSPTAKPGKSPREAKEAPKNGKAGKGGGNGKPAPRASGGTGNTLRDQLGLREGSLKQIMVDFLLANLGKKIKRDDVNRKVYGSVPKSDKLKNVEGGMLADISSNNVKLDFKRTTEDGVTYVTLSKRS